MVLQERLGRGAELEEGDFASAAVPEPDGHDRSTDSGTDIHRARKRTGGITTPVQTMDVPMTYHLSEHELVELRHGDLASMRMTREDQRYTHRPQ